MNRAGYDFAVLGNHEFDYGMERLGMLLESSKVQYLGCNIRYSGEGKNALKAVEPYRIVSYGDTDMVALHPYGNTLCVVEATGQEILDACLLWRYPPCQGCESAAERWA